MHNNVHMLKHFNQSIGQLMDKIWLSSKPTINHAGLAMPRLIKYSLNVEEREPKHTNMRPRKLKIITVQSILLMGVSVLELCAAFTVNKLLFIMLTKIMTTHLDSHLMSIMCDSTMHLC